MQIQRYDRRLVIFDPAQNRIRSIAIILAAAITPIILIALAIDIGRWTWGGTLLFLAIFALPWTYVLMRIYTVRLELDLDTGQAILQKSRLIGNIDDQHFAIDQIDCFFIEPAAASTHVLHRDDFPQLALKDGRRIAISGRSFPRNDERLAAAVVEANRFIGRPGDATPPLRRRPPLSA